MNKKTPSAKEKPKSKRQQGIEPDPVTLYKSPAKEVRRLLEANPATQTSRQQASTPTSLSLPGSRRGSWNSDGRRQPSGGRISPGIQERIQTLESASSSSTTADEDRPRTLEAPRANEEPDPTNPLAMAIATVHPPLFTGGEHDNPKDWLERFDIAAKQNNWTDAIKATQFGAYMDGMARQWYNNAGNLPTDWLDVAATANTGARKGMRTAFLEEFQSTEYKRALRKKLKARRQSPKQQLMAYFLDVIDLCNKLDPNMTEEDQVKYAIEGLLPRLKEKIIPLPSND